eukprot:COSAG05_NODE_347_length_10963_cov_157.340943_6_plen_35_part_00
MDARLQNGALWAKAIGIEHGVILAREPCGMLAVM